MNGMPPFIPDEFRTDVEVLQRFGDAFYQNSSIGKTQLYLASKLRWDSFLKYVNWMKKMKRKFLLKMWETIDKN